MRMGSGKRVGSTTGKGFCARQTDFVKNLPRGQTCRYGSPMGAPDARRATARPRAVPNFPLSSKLSRLALLQAAWGWVAVKWVNYLARPKPESRTGSNQMEPVSVSSRVFILAAAVLGFVTLRLDRFVRIALETNWLPQYLRDIQTARELAQQANQLESAPEPLPPLCSVTVCWRLDAGWVAFGLAAGIATTIFVLIVLARARRRFDTEHGADEANAAAQSTIFLLKVLWGIVLALGAAVLFARTMADAGVEWGPALLTGVGVAQLFVVLLTLFVLARIVAARGHADVSWDRLSSTFRRQRATIVILAIFALFVLFLPLTSDQVADSLRALELEGAVGWANVLFICGNALLLCAAALEIWRAIERRHGSGPIPATEVRARIWLFIGLALVVVGVVAWIPLQFTGGGIFALGLVFLLLGALQFGNRKKPPEAVSGSAGLQGTAAREAGSYTSSAARYVAVIPLVALAIAIFGASVENELVGDFRVLGLLGAGLAVGVLGGFAVVVTRSFTGPRFPRGSQWLVNVVTFLPLLAAALIVPIGGFSHRALLVAAILSSVGFAAHLSVIARREGDKTTASSFWTIAYAIVWPLVLGIAIHLHPIVVPRAMGTVALLLAFVAGLLALGFFLSLISARLLAPRSLEWFGLHQLPVFTLVLVWWLVAGIAVFVPANMHDVRIVAREKPPAGTPSLESAFLNWRDSQPEFRDGAAVDGRTIPLVIVASHGGGIRAAYWTGVALDCLIGTDPVEPTDKDGQPGDDSIGQGHPDGGEGQTRAEECATNRRTAPESLESARRIFLASGVSGGAVGLAAYSQQMLEGGLESGWVGTRLDADLLAPVMGWALFHDLPNHLIGLNPMPGGGCRFGDHPCLTQDRAAVLEQAIDAEVPGSDQLRLRETWDARRLVRDDLPNTADDHPGVESAVPLLIFNSSTPNEPNRAITSVANLADWPVPSAAVHDSDAATARPVSDATETVALLCANQDLRISTAATLAARFPYISPTGYFHGGCGTHADKVPVTDAARCLKTVTCQQQLSDGGDLENSGLMTIAEILPSLQELVAEQNARTKDKPIAIVVVDLDNDYRDPDAAPAQDTAVPETIAPLKILLSGANAMENAAFGFVQERLPSACFITLAPTKQPGIQAPLGWTLSEASRENLRGSLVGTPEQKELVKRLQYWLAPEGAVVADARRAGVRDVVPEPRTPQEVKASRLLNSCVPTIPIATTDTDKEAPATSDR
jgi:hypothetical protein